MCYDEGILQEFLDREMPGHKRWEIEAHIASCEECRKRLRELEKANAFLASSLSKMSDESDVGEEGIKRAWARLAKDERFGAPVEDAEVKNMKGALSMNESRLRKILVPAAAVAAIAIAFSFAPVRSFAADVLNIFRVENIEVISFSMQDVQKMEQQIQKVGSENGGIANVENFGKIESTGFKQPEEMSVADAEKAAGFELKFPEQIDGQAHDAKVQVIKGSKVSFTLDVKKANKLIAMSGGDIFLPNELDGKTFSIKIPTGVAANYQKTGGMITIAKAESPEMMVPDGVSPEAVRNVLLNLPMIPENVKQQLEAIEDWKQTLIVPNIDGSTQEVEVNGAKGVFMTPPEEKEIGQMKNGSLLWQKDGIVYMIGGNLDLAKAQEIAASMK